MPRKMEIEDWLEFAKHQRHDLLNHFQVILGFLQMGRQELCIEYIRKMTKKNNQESRIASLGYPPLEAYLLTFNALHTDFFLEVDIPHPIDLNQYRMDKENLLRIISRLVEIYRSHMVKNQGKVNSCYLTLQIIEEYLNMIIEFEGEIEASACYQELQSFSAQMQNEGSFFVEGLHNSTESVMEINIPLLCRLEVNT